MLHFCVRAWRLATGAFRVAGVALMVAALGNMCFTFVWQAWHLVTSTCLSCGRRGTYGAGLALVAALVGAWLSLGRCGAAPLWRGRRGTWRQVLHFYVAGLALGDIHARRLVTRAFRVAGVALTALGWLWRSVALTALGWLWRRVALTALALAKRCTYGTGLALAAALATAGRRDALATAGRRDAAPLLRGRRGAWRHLPFFLRGRRGT
eukprot:s233_g50.t1